MLDPKNLRTCRLVVTNLLGECIGDLSSTKIPALITHPSNHPSETFHPSCPKYSPWPLRQRERNDQGYDFLLPLLFAVRLSGYSGNRSGKFACTRKKDGVV